ncbi:predicted ATP-grasp enzyme [Serpentinimonas maccroryi]|uniref:Predicted ATP-grasp enzyme n=1 Tax=Serpentinimonas maccroryi TaxID=1458426 RepID=A0A060NSA0_9BURK|nr:predicted ATP-grasp enzyme [Serpentinimonas maccroryi]
MGASSKGPKGAEEVTVFLLPAASPLPDQAQAAAPTVVWAGLQGASGGGAGAGLSDGRILINNKNHSH